MIGLLAIQALRLAGCACVIAVDVDDAKLTVASQLGADYCANPNSVDVPAFTRERTNGRGADIALEVVGATQPLQTALASLRKAGSMTLVGNVSPEVALPLQSVVTRQIRLTGSCASSGEYPACISLLASGAIRVEPMISSVAPLEEGPLWFQRLYHKEPNLMKVILKP